VYFWRVSGINRCGDEFTTPISTFAAESLTCKAYTENEVPVNLSSSGTPTTTLESVIVATGQVSDINVTLFKGTHTNVKDLRVSLVSPEGKSAILFNQRCLGSTSFNVGFDSESPADIQCPMLNSAKYKPEESLDIFTGDELQGTWELVIEDLVSGDGGKVDEYILEVCSNVSLGEAPNLDKNNALKIVPGAAELINQGRLKVIDGDNDDDELTFTLVEIPTKGDLRLNGTPLAIGSTFTQQDLNNNYISYQHTASGNDTDADSFVFVVDDSEGGWIDLTTFDIGIDLVNDVDQELFSYDVEIFPNPTDGEFLIDIANSNSKTVNVEILNVLGQTVLNQTRNGGQKMAFDLSSQASGSYFVKIDIEGSSKIFKITVR
jgi:subtilisin-like proprotein convertase family protein